LSKLDKRAISILVIAILALSFVLPLVTVAAPLSTPVLTPSNGQKGDTIEVAGIMGDATSGATIEIYWDTAIGEDAQLLNSTTAKADGSYTVEFDIPEAIAGAHYVWVKDTSGPFYEGNAVFIVDRLVKLSPSSGLPTDEVDVKGYGFDDDVVVGIKIDKWAIPTEIVGTGDGLKTVFNLDHFPVVAASESIWIETVLLIEGTGYNLVDSTGVITFLAGAIPGAGDVVTAAYTRDFYTIESSSTFKTDELGSFTKTFNIPSFPYGTEWITATELVSGLYAQAELTIGASISITPEEGPTGTRVTVSGRGWTDGLTITLLAGGDPVGVVGGSSITISGGKFSADIVIPGTVAEGDCSITASEGGPVSSATFDVTGLPEVVVSPTYGSPGATISVTGSNFTQIAGIDVVIELMDKTGVTHIADLVTAETNSDGTFEDTFMSPAVAFIGYKVHAYDSYYHIEELDAFKVGLIAMIINPTHGSAGTEVALTGIGFYSDEGTGVGDFNMTFGEKLYEYPGGVDTEAISRSFFVPNVELGTYDVTVIDEDENELTVHFTVTSATEIILDPAKAPNDYNVTIEGHNFANYIALVDFVLYNATDEWDMDVDYEKASVKTDIDGNFTGYWMVDPEADISLGDYTINVTGHDDFFLQVPFSVVEARVSVAPRKLLFDRGDTIQFNVKNDFDFEDSYMEIWDPYDNLYWKTEVFGTWLKVGDVYTVPYYLQTSGMNPMTLSQDAPIGPWFYIFYEEGTTQLTNGTFEVGPSAAAQVDQKLSEIWASMEGITEDIDGITDEIGDDIDALSGEIDDVVADVQGMIDDITSDLAGELAGVAADTEAAVGELEDSIGDIAAAQNALADEVGDMSQDTAAARQAAEDAQGAAQGLTTIVYGAIGCSLIAALAAIMSLMQISKKIA